LVVPISSWSCMTCTIKIPSNKRCSKSLPHPNDMASSSSSTTAVPSAFSVPISKKLTKSNYLLWQAQVMPAICAAEFEGFLTGAEKAPSKIIASKDDKVQVVKQHNLAYSQWVACDEAVLGYLLSSLIRETLVMITHVLMQLMSRASCPNCTLRRRVHVP
jgi:hypothetical protein